MRAPQHNRLVTLFMTFDTKQVGVLPFDGHNALLWTELKTLFPHIIKITNVSLSILL